MYSTVCMYKYPIPPPSPLCPSSLLTHTPLSCRPPTRLRNEWVEQRDNAEITTKMTEITKKHPPPKNHNIRYPSNSEFLTGPSLPHFSLKKIVKRYPPSVRLSQFQASVWYSKLVLYSGWSSNLVSVVLHLFSRPRQ